MVCTSRDSILIVSFNSTYVIEIDGQTERVFKQSILHLSVNYHSLTNAVMRVSYPTVHNTQLPLMPKLGKSKKFANCARKGEAKQRK